MTMTYPDMPDLIIEPLPQGMVLIGAKISAGLNDLEAALSDHQDGLAVGMLSGGCAKKMLAVILQRPAPDLFVGQGFPDGSILGLDTVEERKALLDVLGEHSH